MPSSSWCHRQRVAARRGVLVAALVATAVLGAPAPAAAGPWVPAPGEGYAKLWLKWFYGFGFHTGDGQTEDYGTYNEVFLATYGEVGVAPRLALYWHTDLLRTFFLEDPSTETTDGHAGPGDPALGLRYQFLDAGRFVMAVEGWSRVPLANGEPVQSVRGTGDGNPVIGALRIGAGAVDLGAGLSAGYGWDRVYAAAFASYIFRSEGYDHVINWTAEFGYGGGNGFAIRGRAVGYHSLANGTAVRAESPSGMGNGTNYIGFAIETDWELSAGTFIGVTFEGGVAALSRQSGGPVISLYWAQRF